MLSYVAMCSNSAVHIPDVDSAAASCSLHHQHAKLPSSSVIPGAPRMPSKFTCRTQSAERLYEAGVVVQPYTSARVGIVVGIARFPLATRHVLFYVQALGPAVTGDAVHQEA
jgi:hypothetical protein